MYAHVCMYVYIYIYVYNETVQLSPHALKPYRGIMNAVPLILNFHIIWSPVSSFTPQPIYSGYRTQNPLNKRLGGFHSQSGRAEVLIIIYSLDIKWNFFSILCSVLSMR